MNQYTWIGDHIKYSLGQISEYNYFIKNYFFSIYYCAEKYGILEYIKSRICSKVDGYFVQEFYKLPLEDLYGPGYNQLFVAKNTLLYLMGT